MQITTVNLRKVSTQTPTTAKQRPRGSPSTSLHKREWCLVCCLLLALSFIATATAPAEERQADHDALRAMLRTATEALNTRNFDAIRPLLADNFTVVTVDNQKFTRLDDFRAYWNGLFTGDAPVLQGIEVNAVADDLTTFLDASTGVVHGTSQDTYHFTGGDVREMPTRWTAVVQKVYGQWKLVKVHFSANLLDNPVLDAAKAGAMKLAGLAFLAGIILGAVVVFLMKRRGGAQSANA
ncbi:MAG: YybH family protein [Gammaproteobacteria bacterium]